VVFEKMQKHTASSWRVKFAFSSNDKLREWSLWVIYKQQTIYIT